MRRALALVLSAGIVLVAISSCKPAPGGDCKRGQAACLNKSSALFCKNGKFTPVSCSNESCAVTGGDLVCDQSQAELGQLCIADLEYACGSDKITGMQCVGGSFQRTVVCRGPKGCKIENKRVTCDSTIAMVAEPCVTEGALACSSDKTAVLRCSLKQFDVSRLCRGPLGCVPDEAAPQCDGSLAKLDDPCPRHGLLACSLDKQSELLCQGGRFTLSRTCKKGCTSTAGGRSIECK